MVSERAQRWPTWLRDASGSVADLGVLAPITAALVLGNKMDAATIFVGFGALYLVAGYYFRVPIPVQPIKAAAAITIARGLAPETLATAGVLLGVILLVLGATGASNRIAKAFTTPIVRGLQLGVGLILIRTGVDLASRNGGVVPILVAVSIAVLMMVASRFNGRYPVALAIVVGAILFTLFHGGSVPHIELALWSPDVNVRLFDLSVLGSAMVLLVIPQIPLTFGNAVVAVVDLEHLYFPRQSTRVSPRSVSLSCGVANIAAGALTGVPMCHGSGGLTAHYRAGARTFRMNVFIGAVLLSIGLFFGPTAVGLLTLIPAPVLAGFLAFTGLFHSALATSLRGVNLLVAVAIGVIGAVTTNLAIALAVGLALHWSLNRALGPRTAQATES